jgi:H+-transporting ATPase
MADLAIIPTMAIKGIMMAPLPIPVVLGLFGAAVVLALVLDQVKLATFGWLRMA